MSIQAGFLHMQLRCGIHIYNQVKVGIYKTDIYKGVYLIVGDSIKILIDSIIFIFIVHPVYI